MTQRTKFGQNSYLVLQMYCPYILCIWFLGALVRLIFIYLHFSNEIQGNKELVNQRTKEKHTLFASYRHSKA